MSEVPLYLVPRINQSTYGKRFWLAVHFWGAAFGVQEYLALKKMPRPLGVL